MQTLAHEIISYGWLLVLAAIAITATAITCRECRHGKTGPNYGTRTRP